MKTLLNQSFFRLLSDSSQRDISEHEASEALEELIDHVVGVGLAEQDYTTLFRYFSFGLNRLKSYRAQFGQGEKYLVLSY